MQGHWAHDDSDPPPLFGTPKVHDWVDLMEILQGLPNDMYIANLKAVRVHLLTFMIVASLSKAWTRIIHLGHDEQQLEKDEVQSLKQ